DPFGEHAVARRPGDVRLGGEKRVRVARAIGGGKREEAALDRSLSLRGARGKAVDLRCLRRRHQKISTTEDTEDAEENTCRHLHDSTFGLQPSLRWPREGCPVRFGLA